MIDTGKVTSVINKGDETILEIVFINDLKTTVILPHQDIDKYKDKYVICAMDSDNNTKILDIVDD